MCNFRLKAEAYIRIRHHLHFNILINHVTVFHLLECFCPQATSIYAIQEKKQTNYTSTFQIQATVSIINTVEHRI